MSPFIPATVRRRLHAVAPVVPAVVLMSGLAVWGLGRPSMFGSEAVTYWAAGLRPRYLAHLLTHVDAVHGLYYLLMHAWLGIAPGVIGMRSLSALSAVATVGVTAALGITLTGSRLVGATAGLLLALSPTVNNYAQVGRSYQLVGFLVATTALTLVHAVQHSTRGRWLAYGLLVAVTGYLHELTLLTLLAYGTALATARTPRRVLVTWLATSSLAAATVTPLLLISSRESGAIGYLRPPDLSAVHTLITVQFGQPDRIAWILGLCALLAVVPVRRGAWAAGLSLPRVAVPLLVLPPLALLVESRVRTPLYDVRYVLYTTVPAALLAAAGAVRAGRSIMSRWAGVRTRRWVAAVPVLAVCLAAAVLQWPSLVALRTVGSRHQDFAGASRFLAASARPGDAVLFMPLSVRSAQLGYPQEYRSLVDLARRRTPEQSGTIDGLNRAPGVVLRAMDASPRIWVVGTYPLVGGAHGLPGVARSLRTRYRATTIGRFAGADVVLYVRSTPAPIAERKP